MFRGTNSIYQDSEFTSQVVPVDRLYHRQLLARLSDIAIMEKKWNCKIIFPGTEQASDEVTFTGPQWQVPLCVDEFLVSTRSNLFTLLHAKLRREWYPTTTS